MKNHLIYVTYGEEKGSVYTTQVIQLLNYWSERKDWIITLVQISFSQMFSDINQNINKVYIKRENKWLFERDKIKYANKMYEILNFQDVKVYFNSRGGSAYDICQYLVRSYNIDYKVNNYDVRGIPEEFKYSLKRCLAYPIMKKLLKNRVESATSITTVSHDLKRYLEERYQMNQLHKSICVIPTLSIMNYKESKYLRKDIVYIGKIAWVAKNTFIKYIIEVNNLMKSYNWKIKIIGNPSSIKILEDEGIIFNGRMAPKELYKTVNLFHSGLIIRDESIVNKVSAPCKISDYLCLGMPVIYSGEIGSIKDFIEEFPEERDYIVNINKLHKENIYSYINISEEERKVLSEKASSYFGVIAVVDKYIDFFSSL